MKGKKDVVVLIGLLCITFSLQAQSPEGVQGQLPVNVKAPSGQVFYTIQGKKDPRLSATFIATYASTSKSNACSSKQATTGTRKLALGHKVFHVTEEYYQIKIPIFLEENENECGYQFRIIELNLRRLYDEERYSRHIILSSSPKVSAIYRGRKGGFGGQASLLTPAELSTNRRYFRISRFTKYICKTAHFDTFNRTIFSCRMEIKDGEGGNKFIPTNKNNTKVTHPEFGIDVIENDLIKVDIIADDADSFKFTGKERVQDFFRILPKP